MRLAVTEDELRRLLSEVAFTRSYGFLLHAIAEDTCTLRIPFKAEFERPGGVVGGQVFMAAADVAMWLALMTRLGSLDKSVTAEMKTNFLSGARYEDFFCTARILKFGQRLVFGVAESIAADGRLLAHSTVTYIRSGPGIPSALSP